MGDERAALGFEAPGKPALDADTGTAAHRHEGEQAWMARYRPAGGFGDALLWGNG